MSELFQRFVRPSHYNAVFTASPVSPNPGGAVDGVLVSVYAGIAVHDVDIAGAECVRRGLKG